MGFATLTAVATPVLAVGLLWLFGPIFESFYPKDARHLWWVVVGTALVVVELSLLANFLAIRMMRGRRWARWALIALCFPAALGSALGGYFVAPLMITAAAISVVVLLLLPSARAWFRRTPVPGHELVVDEPSW